MTDAHFHRNGTATFLSLDGKEYRFAGVHPWEADAGVSADRIETEIAADIRLGVGETGLDRLRSQTISESQRTAFGRQLEIAARFRRPVVLHGAKCWGEVAKACRPFAERIPAFLFHGFSRSEGLVPDIVRMNGFISLGPALLNDHAVNYRAMAAKLPGEIVLVETDLDETDPEKGGTAVREETCAHVLTKLAELRGVTVREMEETVAANAARFIGAIA